MHAYVEYVLIVGQTNDIHEKKKEQKIFLIRIRSYFTIFVFVFHFVEINILIYFLFGLMRLKIANKIRHRSKVCVTNSIHI